MDVKTKMMWLCDILDEALSPGWCMQLLTASADDNCASWTTNSEMELTQTCHMMCHQICTALHCC